MEVYKKGTIIKIVDTQYSPSDDTFVCIKKCYPKICIGDLFVVEKKEKYKSVFEYHCSILKTKKNLSVPKFDKHFRFFYKEIGRLSYKEKKKAEQYYMLEML